MAGDRRRHAGEFQIQRLGLDFCTGGGDSGLGCADGGASLLHRLLGNRPRGDQAFGAFEVGAGLGQFGAGLHQTAIGGSEFRLEGARIDGEQKLPRLDRRPIFKVNGIEITAHPSAYVDPFGRVESTGEFVPVGDTLNQRHGDLDLGWRHAALLVIAAAGRQEDGGQQKDTGSAGE